MRYKVMQFVVEGKVIVPHVLAARSMPARMLGLLGRKGLPQGQAMLLDPCSSIHTVGMRFSLDVVFLDRSGKIVRIAQGVRPNRFLLGGRGAHHAIEMEAGSFDLSVLAAGKLTQLIDD